MGVYGNYYLKRAIVAQVGLGANLPEDAIYPVNLGDEAGRPLDGANRYRIHFAKSDTPPADAFCSVTLYDAEGFQIANPLNRFAVSSWMPLKHNADGSLYFQNASPGARQGSKLVPSPKGSIQFDHAPLGAKSEALTGKWDPPPVTRVQALPGMGARRFYRPASSEAAASNAVAPFACRRQTWPMGHLKLFRKATNDLHQAMLVERRLGSFKSSV